MFLNSNGRVSSNNPLDSRNLLTAGRTAYNPRSPSRHPVAPQILVRRAAARSSMTARITPSSPHSGETRYHSTGPISTRSTTDLEPEPDRSRGGTGPISAKSPGGARRHRIPPGPCVLGAPGAIRTRDTRFRRAVLYPLSYEGLRPTLPHAAPSR